jgi:hypothetical protein
MAELEVINSMNGMSLGSNIGTPELNSRSSSNQVDQAADGEVGFNSQEESIISKPESTLISESIASLEKHEAEFVDQQKEKQAQLHLSLIDRTKVPESYYSNSSKEDLVLSFAENFNRQYTQLYPGRKELLLSPPNEMDTKKFISSFIRPTQLPFNELYDYRSCAKFVASFLNYVPLEPPHDLVRYCSIIN